MTMIIQACKLLIICIGSLLLQYDEMIWNWHHCLPAVSYNMKQKENLTTFKVLHSHKRFYVESIKFPKHLTNHIIPVHVVLPDISNTNKLTNKNKKISWKAHTPKLPRFDTSSHLLVKNSKRTVAPTWCVTGFLIAAM